MFPRILHTGSITGLDKICQLIVVSVDVYEYNPSPSLKKTARNFPNKPDSRIPREVDIIFMMMFEKRLKFGHQMIRLAVEEQYFENVASIDEVRAIEEVHKPVL